MEPVKQGGGQKRDQQFILADAIFGPIFSPSARLMRAVVIAPTLSIGFYLSSY